MPIDFEKAKQLNKILTILHKKYITKDILRIQRSPNEYVMHQDVAEVLGLNERRLDYYLQGISDDKFIGLHFYPNENNLDYCFITENGRYFIEHGGYVSKKKKDLAKEIIKWSLPIIALIFSAISTYLSCNKPNDIEKIQKQQDLTNQRINKISTSLDSVLHKSEK